MTDIMEAIRTRRSVRAYQERPLEADVQAELETLVSECNRKGGLHIQLVTNEPKGFECFWAHYGKFSGVRNYFAMVGPQEAADLDERLGYYGERLVLRAQQLGLNTCWVGLSYKKVKGVYDVGAGERLRLVIAVGYGQPNAPVHKNKCKRLEQVVGKTDRPLPAWFVQGVEAALRAPTAVNQQQFRFSLSGNRVTATAGMGFYSKVDLGIVKLHFEIGAGREHFVWA